MNHWRCKQEEAIPFHKKHLKKQSRRHRGSPLHFPVSYHKPRKALKTTVVNRMKSQTDFSCLDHHKRCAQQGGMSQGWRQQSRYRAASSSSQGMALQHSARREDTASGTSQEVNLAGQSQEQPSVITDKELGWALSSIAVPEPPRDRAQLSPSCSQAAAAPQHTWPWLEAARA